MSARFTLPLVCAVGLVGCDLTDPATRLAYDIKAGASRLGAAEGAATTIRHPFPSKSRECVGPYRVQVDKVGALIVWCNDASGTTISSHSTTYSARFVQTPQTHIVDKPAHATLEIELVRQQGQAVVADVR